MNRRRLVVMILSALAFTSCGVPSDPSARLVPGDRIPDALKAVATAPPASAEPNELVDLWFVHDDHLMRVRHPIATPIDAESVVAGLLSGPTDDERATTLRSAIPDSAAVDAVEVSGGVASVHLSPTFADIPAGDQLLAIAQVVLTLTDLRGIGRVRFFVGDAAATVPLSDGTTSDASVSRDDYSSLIAV